MNESHGHYAYEIHGAADEHHRQYDTESEVRGLREDLNRAFASMADLAEDLNSALERIRELEDARQASAARALAEYLPSVEQGFGLPYDPGAARERSMATAEQGPGWDGEPAPLDGTPACLCTDPDCPDPVHQEPAEPEPEEYDPGPEVADEGGMSEFGYANPQEEPG